MGETVTVFGSAKPRPCDEQYVTAEAVGRSLAELGYAIANGGYGGVMEASARGAVAAGGRAVGVTCSLWSSSPNRYLTAVEPAADLAGRIARLIELGGAGYVCLPGSTGTLVELATAWEMMFKGVSSPRPLVCVGGFWRPLIDLMVAARAGSGRFISIVDGPDELGEYFPSLVGSD